MQRGVGKRNAVLIEVVANGYLAAECITAAVEIDLVVLVVAGLYEHRHVQVGTADGIDDAHLVAEIRQRNDDSINFIAVLAEEFSTFYTVFYGLDAAGTCRCGFFRQDDIFVTLFVEYFQQLFLHISCKLGIEIGACSDNHAKTLFVSFHDGDKG